MTVKNSRKKSPVTYSEIPLFFSLVDYRNNYFTSDDPTKIIEFYNGFDNREQLIQWMKERPKGVAYVHEVGGDKDIIVVIPTADFNGKYAKECRENIFKSLHIIFVESGEVPDPYFNYAHNVNIGIKKAMEYNPKWVVVSNDDMVKIDGVDALKSELTRLDSDKLDAVFTEPSPTKYHSKPSFLGRPNIIGELYYLWCQKTRVIPYDFWVYLYKGKRLLNLRKDIILLPQHFVTRFFFHKLKKLVLTMSFSIFSIKFIKSKNGRVFNESFLNGAEDWDISYQVFFGGLSYEFIHYRISEKSGGTLSSGGNRAIRDNANVLLFNELHEADFR